MRHADDLSDDESVPHEQRRVALQLWLDAWHRADAGLGTSDPVFVALADARRRFQIPSALLDELVEGTTMDLRHAAEHPNRPNHRGAEAVHQMHFDVYPTFADLYRYCYLVASVVGLVCIRIFGYEDARAEKLAEETGIAFQLTNILRDVREDALRGRVYLPVEDMERLGVIPEELASLEDGHRLTLNQRELLETQAQRAEQYYQSGLALLPLIAADSRPALWVLITIYHRLLRRIEQRNFDVFSVRVSVPTYEKLWILLRGMLRMMLYRLGAV
jgi:phytoene synthase